jgi:DNA-binding SARP family transcriptional activator/tetratricopeptide (TPR) repeat protein
MRHAHAADSASVRTPAQDEGRAALTVALGCPASLRIELFGDMRVERDGRDVTAELPGRQGRALLACFALNRHRPIERDQLLDVLWPSAPPSDPQAALSSVLAKVRRAVGSSVLSGRGALTFAPAQDAELDIQELVESVERAEDALGHDDPLAAMDAARAARAIVVRPLLAGLDGRWLDPWREVFAEYDLRALAALARAGLALGGDHLQSAERAATAVLDHHAYRESAYGLLMQIQAKRGNAAEALRTFERLRVLLRDELGITPSPALVELHGSLLRGELPPRTPRTAMSPYRSAFPMPSIAPGRESTAFVGREPCLQRLRERWRDGHESQAQLVLLVGEAGIGKTSLARRFGEEVHADGGVVLYGRADEDALLPHQPFVTALRSLLSHGGAEFAAETAGQRDILGRLIPEIRPAWEERVEGHNRDALRFALFEAVADLLARASRRWPLLLVLDDLHWADKPTLLLLRHLLLDECLQNLLVIGTFRDVEVARDHALVRVLADLRGERRFDRMALEGVDEASAWTLAVDRLGRDVTPGFITRLREQTRGNAFFIDETLRALVESGLPDDAVVSEDHLARLGVPEGVADVITRRIGRLSPLTAEVLTSAAVVGRDFRLGVVEQLMDATAEAVLSGLEQSIAAGLVVESPDRVDVFAFSHQLVRDVLYGQLSTSRRVRLHHRVALALEAIGDRQDVSPAELAHHFELASHVAGTEPARRYAIRAGHHAAELLAYEEASRYFRRALSLFADIEESERCDVLLALGRVQWHAGENPRPTFLEAADSASRRGSAEQLAKAALGLGERWFETAFVGSRYRELLEEALAVLDDSDSELRALLLARLAEHVGFPSEHERALALSDEALRIATRLGDEDVLIATSLARQVTLSDVRHLDERLALGTRLASLRGVHREHSAEHHHWRIYDLMGVGDLEAARDEQRHLETVAEELRQPLFRSLATGWRGVWAELSGDIEVAERCAETCLRHARRADMKDALSTWAARLIMLRRSQQRLGELAPVVEQLAASSARGTGWPSVLGLIHAETGAESCAHSIYERELSHGVEGIPRGMFWLANVVLLSALCVKLRDVERAGSLYDILAPHARRNVIVGYSSCWGPVEGWMAFLALTMGDPARADRHVRSAQHRTRALGAPLLTAELGRQYDELLLGAPSPCRRS